MNCFLHVQYLKVKIRLLVWPQSLFRIQNRMDPHWFGSLDQDPDLDTLYRTETTVRIRNTTIRYVLINQI